MQANSIDIWWTFLVATSILLALSLAFVGSLVVSNRRYIKMQSHQTEELRKREERFRLLVERSSDALLMFDSLGGIVYASPNVPNVLGSLPSVLERNNLLEIVHPADRQTLIDLSRDVLQTSGGQATAQCRIRDEGGDWRYIELIVSNFIDEPAVGALAVNCRDITERKRTEQYLKRLTQRIIEIQESESRRIAGELHDGIAQMLQSAKLIIDTVQERRTRVPRDSRSKLRDASEILADTIGEVRRMLRNLRPVTLEKLGLVPAIRNLSEDFTDRTGIHIALHQGQGLPKRFLPDVELALFRIVQEALANIEKHSRATKSTIDLRVEDSVFHLSIKDNGKGFSQTDQQRHDKGPHLGLLDMTERASYVGGELAIRSHPRRGTEVLVRLPMTHFGEPEGT